MRSYVIVTPAKNEELNVPYLVESIARQTLMPEAWFFVNDVSTDNTVDLFLSEVRKYISFSNTEIRVVNHVTCELEYGLGKKYSSVVRYGFDKIEEFEKQTGKRFDYFALLDCDVFPEDNYYEKLIFELEKNKKLGIVSGGRQYEIDTGLCSFVYKRHAAGMMRLWRRQCFIQTGYYPSISQDSVSEARAKMMGWKTESFSYLSVKMRSMGSKSKYEYYGKSYYIRWCSPIIVYLHYLKLKKNGKKNDARLFLKGYREAKKQKIERLNDELAKKYFSHQLFYKLIGK